MGQTTPNSPTPIFITNQGQFHAGRNCLEIILEKGEGSRIAVLGYLLAQSAVCPDKGLPLIACPGVCYELYLKKKFWEDVFGEDEDAAWQGRVCNGSQAGTTGEHRRAEAVRAELVNAPPGVGIRYRAWRRRWPLDQASDWGSTDLGAELATSPHHPTIPSRI